MDYAKRVRQALRTRCVHLRTKAAFFPLPQPGDEENPFDTAVWWCERTCASLGEDGSTAHPSLCDVPGRSCYVPPPRLG
jgi:hypothetical protein